MKIGITVIPSTGRISPMLEASGHLLTVSCCHGAIRELGETALPSEELEKLESLKGSGIRLLVCGALANETRAWLDAQDIEVCPFVSGDWRVFLEAWLRAPEQAERFVMPGCCRHHRQCCGRGGCGQGCRGEWNRAQDGSETVKPLGLESENKEA